MDDKIKESIADLLNARSVITLMVFGTTCVMALTNQPIPPILEKGCYALFGVWFGEKALGYIKNGGAK